jgi:hypothetical protein
MQKRLALLFFGLLLIGCASPPTTKHVSPMSEYELPVGAIVLRVEVLDVEFTDLFPGCGTVPDCMPFHFWFRYRARVKEVVVGEWASPEVKFTYLQHAEYIRSVTKDCYVVLYPASPEIRSEVGVGLVADRLLSRFFEGDRVLIDELQEGT